MADTKLNIASDILPYRPTGSEDVTIDLGAAGENENDQSKYYDNLYVKNIHNANPQVVKQTAEPSSEETLVWIMAGDGDSSSQQTSSDSTFEVTNGINITGSAKFNNPPIILTDANHTSNSTVTAGNFPEMIRINDNVGAEIGQISARWYPDGQQGIGIYGVRQIGNTTYYPGVRFLTASDATTKASIEADTTLTNYFQAAGNICSYRASQEARVIAKSGAGQIYIYSQADSSGNCGMYRIPSTGSGKQIITITSANVATFNGSASSSSSLQTKENILPMDNSEAMKILDIDVVSFDYKHGFNGGMKNQRGVVAEDVNEIIPFVIYNPDSADLSDASTDHTNVGVDYSKFVPYLIKMCQIQQDEIQKLNVRINELENKNNVIGE